MHRFHGAKTYRNSVVLVNRISVFRPHKHTAMSIGERLRKARRDAGYGSAAAAAQAYGWKTSTYASHENGQTSTPPLESLKRYAKAFRVPINTLIFGAELSASESAKLLHAPVRGIAQAGIWREYEEADFAELDPVPYVPGRWAHLEQFAFRISGPSMNRAGIEDGTFVICVPYFLARAEITDGDVVVVERRRGATIERTVKRLSLTPDAFELRPESTDARFQTAIRIVRNDNMHEDDGTEIEIVGLVIGRYALM